MQCIKRKEQIIVLTLTDFHIFLLCISAAHYHLSTNTSIKLSNGLSLCIELVKVKQIICCFAQIGCIKVLSPVSCRYFKFWKKTSPTCLYSPQHCDNGTTSNRFNYLQQESSENLVTKPLERLLDFTLHFLSFYLQLANVKIRCHMAGTLLSHTCLF